MWNSEHVNNGKEINILQFPGKAIYQWALQPRGKNIWQHKSDILQRMSSEILGISGIPII